MNAIRKHENRLNNAPSAVKEREDQAERRKQNGSTRQVVWNKNSRVKKRKHASLEEIARDQVNACYTKQKQRLIKKLQKRGENQTKQLKEKQKLYVKQRDEFEAQVRKRVEAMQKENQKVHEPTRVTKTKKKKGIK
ncbi:hypothetical protein AAVH_43557 [Aphelenchoides avenae]|nr:hypothetical protein AAVH_43557 [Aphelenchus avenae]